MTTPTHIGSAGTVALIPMKPLRQAKSRLSSHLDSDQRAALTIGMFDNVVAAAAESDVVAIWVVGGDFQDDERSRYSGVQWFPDSGRGLNVALSDAMDSADQSDLASLYLPADLPFLGGVDVAAILAASEGGSKLALAPARWDRGTNALLVPSRSEFRPVLGMDSFLRHEELAQRLAMPYVECRSPGFALDLDTPGDLARCEDLEPGFLDRLTGKSDRSAGLAPESISDLFRDD